MLAHALRVLQVALAAGVLYLAYDGMAPLLRAPAPVPVPVLEATALPRDQKAQTRYRVIGERDLFKSREAARRPVRAQPEEDLQESKLQLRLLGTIAGTSSEFSVAALEDQQTREHLHVRVGDSVGESAEVRVARIEQKRIVLDNHGRLEALTMEEPVTATRPARPRSRSRAATPSRAPRAARATSKARSRRLLDRVKALSAPNRATSRREPDPAGEKQGDRIQRARAASRSLLEQVRLSPSFGKDGALSGMQVTEVVPGTELEAAGVQPGDTIVSVNTMPVQGPSDLPKILQGLTENGQNCLETIGPDGARQTRCWGRP